MLPVYPPCHLQFTFIEAEIWWNTASGRREWAGGVNKYPFDSIREVTSTLNLVSICHPFFSAKSKHRHTRPKLSIKFNHFAGTERRRNPEQTRLWGNAFNSWLSRWDSGSAQSRHVLNSTSIQAWKPPNLAHRTAWPWRGAIQGNTIYCYCQRSHILEF